MLPVWFKVLAIGLVSYEGAIQAQEVAERKEYWQVARAYCDQIGKPLLRIGIRRSFLEPPNGDITLDIDPAVLSIPGGLQGDERDMPFGDREFGVCFNEHTLEHLHYPEDVALAVRECCRVADHAVLLAPSPHSIIGFLHPDHNLRLWFNKNNHIVVEQLRIPRQDPRGFAQAIVTPWDQVPEVTYA